MADFTWGPLDTEPVSGELHLALWWSLTLLDTVIVKSLCEATICIGDSTGPTCLDVEISANSIFFILLVEVVSSTYTSSAQSWHVLEWDSAAVKHTEDSSFRRLVID